MKTLAYWFIDLSRYTKAGILISIDIVFAIFSLWLAFSLRLGELYIPTGNIWILFAISPVLAVPIFLKMGLYRAIIRYIGDRALWTVFLAVTAYALIFTVFVFLINVELGLVPRTVPVINGFLLLLFVTGSRFVARYWLSTAYEGMRGDVSKDHCTKKVIIYGAGSAGAQLASVLECGYEFNPVAFIDDNKSLHKQKINGKRIYPLSSLSYLITRFDITDVLLAIPSVGRHRRNEIIGLLEPYPVYVKSIPRMADIAEGKVKFDELQEVDITDLLGRDAVDPDPTLFHANIAGKVVLVSGAGGSIGSELCRQIIQLQPAKLVLFELNEFALYTIE
ncbi:MAG: polysaccharide biosynthesis protein, partial [Methylococcales bacterium]